LFRLPGQVVFGMPTSPTALPAQPNQSVLDALRCLERIAVESPIGTRELARELAMSRTRVNRLLKTLAHAGYLHQTPKRKYEAGPGMHALSLTALFSSGLMARAMGPLEALRETGLTVALGVLWGEQVSYLYYAEPDMLPGQGIGRMMQFPATGSSIGLVLLSQHEPSDSTAPDLASRLTQFRAQGYAVLARSGEQVNPVSIAVALPEPNHVAVALAGAIAEAEIPTVVARLQETAAAIAGHD